MEIYHLSGKAWAHPVLRAKVTPVPPGCGVPSRSWVNEKNLERTMDFLLANNLSYVSVDEPQRVQIECAAHGGGNI